MKNIITRSMSGIIYVALIAGALLAGPDWFLALTALFALLAVREFQMLTGSDNGHPAIRLLIDTVDIAAAVALCLMTYNDVSMIFFDILLFALYLIVRTTLALYDKRSDAFAATGRSVLSVLYIGLPLAIAALFDRMTYGQGTSRHIVLIIFIMIWLNDTGAYCVGSLFGHHRLFERLSPKKSWEGFWGGMLFCVITGVICAYAINNGQWWQWIGLGVVVCIFSTWGDLFESMMKRSLGVKDSGHLIPGHGGILDRIDSLLLVAPAAFIYTILTDMI